MHNNQSLPVVYIMRHNCKTDGFIFTENLMNSDF